MLVYSVILVKRDPVDGDTDDEPTDRDFSDLESFDLGLSVDTDTRQVNDGRTDAIRTETAGNGKKEGRTPTGGRR